ncbi:MAG: hypothetical protein ACP5N2_05890 [Candidatus Nanoarchaeia archaeon]
MIDSAFHEHIKYEYDKIEDELKRYGSYPLNHELLGYGLNALTHIYLMKRARTISQNYFRRLTRNISNNKIPLDEFIQKYDLTFDNEDKRIIFSLKKIESVGIFVPQQAYSGEIGEKRRVWLFNVDSGNRIMHDSWINKRYATKLTRRDWKLNDLEKSNLVEQGIRFGIDMWHTSVEGTKDFVKKHDERPNLILFENKLIDYYSTLISENII